MAREMKAAKTFEITGVVDENGAPVTCVFKSRHGNCREMPEDIVFGVLCRVHRVKVVNDFKALKAFRARTEGE